MQLIEPHIYRILAPTRDSNQEPPGPQSRVVTTILPMHAVNTVQVVNGYLALVIVWNSFPADLRDPGFRFTPSDQN